MKITKSQLKQIIREELGKTLSEYGVPDRMDQFNDEVKTLVDGYKGKGTVSPADDAFVKYFNEQFDKGGVLHPTRMALSRTPAQITLEDALGSYKLPEGKHALRALTKAVGYTKAAEWMMEGWI